MITLPELLEDPIYKQYFQTPPKLPKVRRLQPPWRVYIQKEVRGKWYKKDCWTYAEAFKIIKTYRANGELYDGAIVSKSKSFAPPRKTVKIRSKFVKDSKGNMVQATKRVYHVTAVPGEDEPHRWCGYCRRPTVFRWFTKHHNFPENTPYTAHRRRCTICGIAEEGVKSYT